MKIAHALAALLVTCAGARAAAQDAAPVAAQDAAPVAAQDAAPIERTSSLSWVRLPGAEACIASQALAERVEARLGRTVFVTASSADLNVEGRVERTAEPVGWRATLVVTDRTGASLGERTVPVEGDDCHAIDDGLVLAIALTIDPDAESRVPEVHGDGNGDTNERIVERVVEVQVPRRDPPGWRGDVTAGVIGLAGTLPSLALGIAGTVVVDPPWRWPVELESILVIDARAALPALSTGGNAPSARFDQLSLGTLICAPVLERPRLRFAPCIGGHIIGTHVEVANATAIGETQRYGVDLAARARVLWRIAGPLVARLAWTFLVPLGHVTWSAHATGMDTVVATALDPDPVGVTLELALGLTLGDVP